MSELSEARVYARHRRRTGAVLIVGAGAVGGFLAEELARLGVSPLRLVDFDVLEVENLVRHPLGARDVGKPKASGLANKIHRDFPPCAATGLDANFLELPRTNQLRLVRAADVVVAATDSVECQRRVNEVCLEGEKPAVYPAVWVDPRVRDAEVGEILWVLPGRHTPCYLCATAWRQGEGDAQARGGTRADIQVLVLATAQVVAGLLDRTAAPAGLLDPEQNCIYVHGFSPPSPGVRNAFQGPGLQSRTVQVPFPATPCPACGGQDANAATTAVPPSAPVPLAAPPEVTAAPPARRGWNDERPLLALMAVAGAAFAILLVVALVWGIHRLESLASGGLAGAQPTSIPNSQQAVGPSQAQPALSPFPPTQTRLLCDNLIAGNGCPGTVHWAYDILALDVSGFTQSVVTRLCQQGYTAKWSDNLGQAPSYYGEMCPNSDTYFMEYPDFSSPGGNMRADFAPPTENGTWVITWTLLDPSGRVVLSATYTVQLVQ